MRWVVIAVLGAAIVAAALIFRDEIQALFGSSVRAETLVYRFDGPVTPTVIERARELVTERLAGMRVTVRVDGDHLAIDVPDARASIDVTTRLAAAERFVPQLDVRILDYDPAYLQDLKAPLRADKRATELGVEIRLDHFGYHLEAPTAGMYVNTAWAEAHHCPTTHRIEGTGVYCTVSGGERIAAVLNGDETLFAEPVAPAVVLAADREIVIGEDGSRARAYVYDKRPIVLEASTITNADAREGRLTLTLSPSAAQAITARVSGPAVELVHVVRGAPSEVKLHAGGVLEVAIDRTDARTFVNALSYAHLPQRLREAPTP